MGFWECGQSLSTNHKLLEEIFSKEREAELATGQQGAPLREARDHKKKKAEGNRGEGTRRKRTGSATASSTTSGAGSDTGCEGRQASAEPDAW